MAESVRRFDFSRTFQKQLLKVPVKVRMAFLERYKLFLVEPHNPQLSNHRLVGKLNGYRGIDVTGDFRALYKEYINESGNRGVIFEMLGTHSQLYK